MILNRLTAVRLVLAAFAMQDTPSQPNGRWDHSGSAVKKDSATEPLTLLFTADDLNDLWRLWLGRR